MSEQTAPLDPVGMISAGSYDGYQETAWALLVARATARNAAELYPGDSEPGRSFREAAIAYVGIAGAALRLPP
jgi:hypothetical protein